MKPSLFVLVALLSLAGTAHAGVPGSIVVPFDQTITCSDQVGDKAVSLTANLVADPRTDMVAFVTQDHVKFVVGTVTLSVSDASPNQFAANDLFMSFPVAGAHKAGVPTFFSGQGYLLRQTDANPLFPAIESLIIQQLEAPSPQTGELAQILQASLKFSGQETATINCQVVRFDLNN